MTERVQTIEETQPPKVKLTLEEYKQHRNKKLKKDTVYGSTTSVGQEADKEDNVFHDEQVTSSPIQEKTPALMKRYHASDCTIP